MNFARNVYMLQLCFFFAIGLYSCYTDIKSRKIKNPLIVTGIAAGIILQLFFSPGADSLKIFSLNIIIGLLASLALWRLNVWAAGDSKFFIFSSVFISSFSACNILKNSPYGFFAVLIPLFNAFILAFLYLLGEAITVLCGKLRRKEISLGFNNLLCLFKAPGFVSSKLKIASFYLASFILFSAAGKYVYGLIPVFPQSSLLFYLILIAAYSLFSKLMKKIKIYYLLFFSLFMILFSGMNFVLIIRGVCFLVFFTLIRILLNLAIQKRQIRVIPVQEIQPNILLSEKEIAALSGEWKAKKFHSDGLSREEAEKLKDYFKAANKENVEIYNTFPFVPFIFAGVIITCLLGGRIINIWGFMR